jgi:hypothetical protein
MAKRPARPIKSAPKEAPMEDVKKTQEYLTQSSGKAVETLTVWADANQRVLRELAELSAATAKESVRLYAELQSAAIEALRDAHTSSLRWQGTWQDYAKDPMSWYQRALTDGVEGAQRAFRMIEGNAQAVTKSAERLQTTAEHAGKTIQETFSSVVNKMKDVYGG